MSEGTTLGRRCSSFVRNSGSETVYICFCFLGDKTSKAVLISFTSFLFDFLFCLVFCLFVVLV